MIVEFVQATIALLEDEPRVSDKLQDELSKIPGLTVKTADNYRDFTRLVRGERFDATSIDWELYSVAKGAETLKLLEKEQPEAAKVVFTRHEGNRDEAMGLKADAFLSKSTDLAMYQNAMENAIRLGQAREIVSKLSVLDDEAQLSAPVSGRWVDEAEETKIRDTAHAAVVKNLLQDSGYPKVDALQSILEKRGWWEPFDPFCYSDMTWDAKLVTLCVSAGISSSDIKDILRKSDEKDDRVYAEYEGLLAPEVRPQADALLSVLAWELQVSGYKPDLMRIVCRKPAMYASSSDIPPWDSLGLVPYLLANGTKGIENSLSWVRK